MSLIGGILKGVQSLASSSVSAVGGFVQPSRSKWTDWRMLKDYKRRQMMIKMNPTRQRINTIRKTDILPPELKEIADADVVAMPRDSNRIRIIWRCSVTSRPRGNVKRWHVSRIVFRHLADYNKLSGVQRALWS